MNEQKAQETVDRLIQKAHDADNALAAMQYTQAATNVAHLVQMWAASPLADGAGGALMRTLIEE